MKDHQHSDNADVGSKRFAIAVGINLLLTVAQVISGVVSGSLSLVADALHNFSDAAGLLLALLARRISRKPADAKRTFGYGRAEVVGGLINLTSIMVIAGYLCIEAFNRIFERPEIDGWMIVIVASIALVVDAATAVLTYSMSKESVNIKAAFLHNLADALASVAVIVSGTLIIFFEWYWTDIAATIGISVYIVWISWAPMKRCIRILMQSAPENLSVETVSTGIRGIDGVKNVAHMHLWHVDENTVAIEAHVGMSGDLRLNEVEDVRRRICDMLRDRYNISHATIVVVPTERLKNAETIVPH